MEENQSKVYILIGLVAFLLIIVILNSRKKSIEVAQSWIEQQQQVEEAISIFRMIKQKKENLLSSFEAKIDPFYFKRDVIYFPFLSLEGIIWDPSFPRAIINSNAYKTGDIVKGAKILKISRTEVLFEYMGKNFVLKLKD